MSEQQFTSETQVIGELARREMEEAEAAEREAKAERKRAAKAEPAVEPEKEST